MAKETGLKELERTSGWSARLWRFSASHDRLTLRLRLGDEEKFMSFFMTSEITIKTSFLISSAYLREDQGGESLTVIFNETMLVTCDEIKEYDTDPQQ